MTIYIGEATRRFDLPDGTTIRVTKGDRIIGPVGESLRSRWPELFREVDSRFGITKAPGDGKPEALDTANPLTPH